MTEGQEHEWHIELDDMRARLRYAKEILGEGGFDCAYRANKELEPVLFRLQELCELTKGESK